MSTDKVERVVSKTSMGVRSGDISFWHTRGYRERLQALEDLRREYNDWKYSDAEQRLQRVYRVVKLK